MNENSQARNAVLAAVESHRFRRYDEYRHHIRALADLAGVDDAIAWWVGQALDAAWMRGWQPADVARALRRRLSAQHTAPLMDAVVNNAERRPEMQTDDRWASQVDALRTEAHTPWPSIAFAIVTLSGLIDLPPLPRLAAGRRAGRGPSPMLEKVRALLAKAESTTFPEEADALTAKAHELTARYSIDQAMLQAETSSAPSEVVGWRIGIEDPYAHPKALLLSRVARPSGCRAVWDKDLAFSTVFGSRTDLEVVEVLFTSLLVQATEAMMRAGSVADNDGRSRTRSFRQSFLVAYAKRIGERLADTTAAVVAESTERHGRNLLPVLARRDEAVDDAIHAAFPHATPHRASVSNRDGWLAGRAAAEMASLSVGQELSATVAARAP
ncbi:MAG: DUF2786 domain-containing protein [Acidimicrobiales bacterium]